MRTTGRRKAIIGVFSLFIACLMSTDTLAQRGEGGNRMAQEQLEAAWKAEAGGVAHDIGLSGDNSTKLGTAYQVSRVSQGKKIRELMAEGQRGPGMFSKMQEIGEAEAAILKSEIANFLNAKEVETAISSLGTYNREWDRYVDTLLGFKLSEDKQFQALSLIAIYVIESDKARATAMAAMDFGAYRQATTELKAILDMSMGGVFSETEQATWNEKTQRRNRGGRGGAGGGQNRPN